MTTYIELFTQAITVPSLQVALVSHDLRVWQRGYTQYRLYIQRKFLSDYFFMVLCV